MKKEKLQDLCQQYGIRFDPKDSKEVLARKLISMQMG